MGRQGKAQRSPCLPQKISGGGSDGGQHAGHTPPTLSFWRGAVCRSDKVEQAILVICHRHVDIGMGIGTDTTSPGKMGREGTRRKLSSLFLLLLLLC